MDNQNTVSAKAYILLFVGLVLLTLISTGLSTLNLGYLNPLIAIGLAVISAGAVFSKFMKIKLDGSFARLLIAGVLVLALLIFFVGFVG
jgi:caa(3)-type oxidase subunit IV